MEKKIIFLDVDGTLCLNDGHISKKHRYACQKAMANGHQIYLCTGRSKAELFEEITSLNFHGIIGAGGGYIEANHHVLFHRLVSQEHCRHAVDYFNENDIAFYLESNDNLYASKNCVKRLEKLAYGEISEMELNALKLEGKYHSFFEALIEDEPNLYRDDVNKICFLDNGKISFEQIVKEFENEYTVIGSTVPMFGSNSGELMVQGVNKATAILELLHHCKGNILQTVAIGDGRNDIEMFELCNQGIAMGNAHPDLIQIADHVVATNTNDGVYEAFVYLGLLD